MSDISLTIAETEDKKAELYIAFYNKNKKNRDLIDEYGRLTQTYWHYANEWIEKEMIEYKLKKLKKEEKNEIPQIRQ